MTLALCMIVKNEEEVLRRCLLSVRGVFDEIVIADTGSEDATKSIAAEFTDKVFDFPWRQDFAAARNFSFSIAGSDYLMWLDADDILWEKDRLALLALKNSLDGSADAFYLRYDAAFDEFGNPALYFYRERIVRRDRGFRWQGAVHETLGVHGDVRRADFAITHLRGKNKERGRNLMIFARLFADGTMPDERQKFYFARELFDNGLYETAASAYEYFLRGDGWAQDKICACRDLSRCYKQLNNRRKQYSALLKSFDYAPPKSETCCELGDFFMQENDLRQAIFWYKLAVNEGNAGTEEGFVCPDYAGYIPYMWLCVCYDRLGEREKARHYNELAGKLKPQDGNYLYNKRYFELSTKHEGENL